MFTLSSQLVRLCESARKLSTAAGLPGGLVSFTGTVAQLKAFVAGADPSEEDWLEAQDLAAALYDLEQGGA